MEWLHALALVAAGVGTGFLVGLVGVGGGIIFAPVLLYYYQAIGVPAGAVAQLAVATSLFCVWLAATSSAWHQYRRQSADLRTAAMVGLSSAAGVYLMAQFVTTRPWFDARIFQFILVALLLASVVRMLVPDRGIAVDPSDGIPRVRSLAMISAGAGAGGLSAVAGVGGGIVLVPVYHNLFRYPIHLATGTSSATIVLTSIAGIITYMAIGTVEGTSPLSVGAVDIGTGLLLAIPASLSSRAGVSFAHRLPKRTLTMTFVVIASLVAAKLLFDAMTF